VAFTLVPPAFTELSAGPPSQPLDGTKLRFRTDTEFDVEVRLKPDLRHRSTPTVDIEAYHLREFQEDNYGLHFPGEYAGARFTILTESSQKLNVDSRDTPVVRDSKECRPVAETIAFTCQRLTGTIPQPTRSSDDFCGNSYPAGTKMGYVGVSFPGRTWESMDWNHSQINFPRFSNHRSLDLAIAFGTEANAGRNLPVRGCKRLVLGPSYRVSSSSLEPTEQGETVDWADPVGEHALTVVAEHRNAQTWGNLLLAVGSLLAGLGAGVVPTVARQLSRSRKRWQHKSTPAEV